MRSVIVNRLPIPVLDQEIFRKYVFFHHWQNAFAGRMKWLRELHLARGPWFGNPWVTTSWWLVVSAINFLHPPLSTSKQSRISKTRKNSCSKMNADSMDRFRAPSESKERMAWKGATSLDFPWQKIFHLKPGQLLPVNCLFYCEKALKFAVKNWCAFCSHVWCFKDGTFRSTCYLHFLRFWSCWFLFLRTLSLTCYRNKNNKEDTLMFLSNEVESNIAI